MFYSLVNKMSDNPEILMYKPIGQAGLFADAKTAEGFIKEVRNLKSDKVTIRFNSPGGSVFDGHAIANFIKQSDKKFTGINDGLCASIASEIFASCDVRKTAKNAKFMIHRVSGTAKGTADQLKAAAERMIEIENDLINTYADTMTLSKEDIKNKVIAETYFNATDALKWGFVDEITDREAELCNYDENFNFINRQKTDNNNEEEKKMNPAILDLLNVKDENEALTAVKNLATEKAELEQKINGLTIENCLASGKIRQSQKDFALSLLNKDKALFEEWLESNELPEPPLQPLNLKPTFATDGKEPTAEELLNNIELFEKWEKEQPEKLRNILKKTGLRFKEGKWLHLTELCGSDTLPKQAKISALTTKY